LAGEGKESCTKVSEACLGARLRRKGWLLKREESGAPWGGGGLASQKVGVEKMRPEVKRSIKAT